MDRRKKEKTTALVLTTVCIILAVCCPDCKDMGITLNATITQRTAYHFFHANIFHALCNAWCLLSLVFFYPVKMWQMAAAYIIAATFPVDTIYGMLQDEHMPTVGLSGVCFAIAGMVTTETRKPLSYLITVLALICVGALFAHMNAILHLYCYMAGTIIACLNTPIQRFMPDNK